MNIHRLGYTFMMTPTEYMYTTESYCASLTSEHYLRPDISPSGYIIQEAQQKAIQ